MPTIGKATIDVDYDGEDLPRQARAIGEKAGAEHVEAFNKELRDGARDLNKDLGKEFEEGGRSGGERYGVKFSDSVDRVMKGRLQKTSDDIAKVFADSDGVEKFVKNYKGAGDATDQLRGDLAKLRLENVLGQREFEELTGRVDAFKDGVDREAQAVRRTQQSHDDYLERLKENSRQHERLTELINGDYDSALANIDRRVQDSADAYEKRYGPALDKAEASTRKVQERVRLAGDEFVRARPGLSSFLGRLEEFEPRYRGITTGLQGVGREVENVAKKATPGTGILSRFSRGLSNIARDGGRAGSALEGLTPNFGKFFRSFSDFDPTDNIGQLLLLIIALAPQVAVLAEAAGAGLLILAGGAAAFAAAGVGFGIAFSNLFGDLKKVDPAVRPAAQALQDFVKKDLAGLRTDLQKQIFTPAVLQQFQAFGTGVTTTLKSAFSEIAPALSSVLLNVSKDLNSSGFKKDLDNLFAGMGPVIKDLGQIARNVFGIIGQVLTDVMPYTKNFTGEVAAATSKFLEFLKSPEGKTAVKDFFDKLTPVLKAAGDAIVDVAAALARIVTPTNIKNTVTVLEQLAGAGPGLAKFASDLNVIITALAGVIHVIGDVAGAVGGFFDDLFSAGDTFMISLGNLFSGVGQAFTAFLDGLSSGFAAAGKAIGQAARGDFAGAAKTIGDQLTNARSIADREMNGLATALGNPIAKFKSLDSNSQASLTALAGRFGIPQAKAQEFGGKIASLAAAAGIDIGTIGKAKGWDDIQAKTGAASGTINDLKKEFGQLPKNVNTNVKQTGAEDAKAKVDTFKRGIDALTSKQVTVKEDGSDASANRVKNFKAKVDALVNKTIGVKETGAADSDARVTALRGKITSLVGKLVKVEESGAAPSDKRVQDLKAEITRLVGKTVTVQEQGAAAAASRVQNLASKIATVQPKTVYINAITRYTSQGAGGTLGATGGLMVGGQLQQFGARHFRAFANGGITGGTQYRGSAIIGEAGPEAIVPLSGSLANVDKSVRSLAAFARGRTIRGSETSGPQKQVNVAQGAIVVHSNVADPRLVGSSVLDRIGIAVGV